MTAIAVQLAEWQTVSPSPGSPTENVNLGSNPRVHDLARRLTETGILEVLELRDGLTSEIDLFRWAIPARGDRHHRCAQAAVRRPLEVASVRLRAEGSAAVALHHAYVPGSGFARHSCLAIDRGGEGTPGEGTAESLRAPGGSSVVTPRPDRFPDHRCSEHPCRGDPAVHSPPPGRGPLDQPSLAVGLAAGIVLRR